MCVLGVFIFMLSDTFVSTCVSILIIFMCLEICSAVDIQSPPQIATWNTLPPHPPPPPIQKILTIDPSKFWLEQKNAYNRSGPKPSVTQHYDEVSQPFAAEIRYHWHQHLNQSKARSNHTAWPAIQLTHKDFKPNYLRVTCRFICGPFFFLLMGAMQIKSPCSQDTITSKNSSSISAVLQNPSEWSE